MTAPRSGGRVFHIFSKGKALEYKVETPRKSAHRKQRLQDSRREKQSQQNTLEEAGHVREVVNDPAFNVQDNNLLELC